MRALGLDAYLIPTNDPHQSEYVPKHWAAREWLSGFTGSAGTLVVTTHFAGLWTDARYFLQAEQELAESAISVQRRVSADQPEQITWLIANLPAGAKLGADGALLSLRQARFMENELLPSGITLDVSHDLIGDIWHSRPPLPNAPIWELDVFFAGKTRADKLSEIRERMKVLRGSHYLVSALDDVAWALNLRGQDIDNTPVFVAYLLIDFERCWLFLDANKIPAQLASSLADDGVLIREYAAAANFLQELSASNKVLVDPVTTSIWLSSQIFSAAVQEHTDIIQTLKAIKNPTEIHHFRQVMRKDAVALLQTLRWLEKGLEEGQEISEYLLAQKLTQNRAVQPDYICNSFDTIAGYNANGAIIHYRALEATAAVIKREGILLLDSGGHYLDGTTDITRTIALGSPTGQQQEHFTLVLKGMIALSKAQFPGGTSGVQLDTLTRLPLWQAGLNYPHGAGHGVGFCLGVHEKPQGFVPDAKSMRGYTALQPGTVSSNEPGYYLEGKYGIRIENLLLCVEAMPGEVGTFLRFDTLTLFPIDRQLILPVWLTTEELNWINDYHAQVFLEVGTLLDDPGDKAWLAAQCEKL
jgi:Xaa-Pro aminopeptidase